MSDKTIQLQDGRTLAFTEHGDLSGKPVLFIHGNPGSRNMRHPDESIAERAGARIITPDRPGFGLSDFQPGRKLLDYPDDVIQLMDSLGIEKFTVLGVSAGGPYAAATTYKLAERVTRTAIVSGVSPIDRENAFEGVPSALRTAYRLVKWLPGWLAQIILQQQNKQQQRDPAGSLLERARILSTFDQETLARPEFQQEVLDYRQEAVRNGVKGMLREMQIIGAPWGFPLNAIEGDVHIWHWEEDLLVPVQMGRYVASQIPGAKTHFLPGGGHYAIFEVWRHILDVLVGE